MDVCINNGIITSKLNLPYSALRTDRCSKHISSFPCLNNRVLLDMQKRLTQRIIKQTLNQRNIYESVLPNNL